MAGWMQMNHSRRVVVSVTLGLLLAVVAQTATRLITDDDGGWFMYAPDSSVQFSSPDGDTLTSALFWLAAIALWAAASWRFFGPRPDDG
jgi:hypothetical protein